MINLRFKELDLTCNVDGKNDKEETVCNSMCIVEPPYSIRSLKCVNDTIKNASVYYRSLTNQVNLNFVYRHLYNRAFIAEYSITSELTALLPIKKGISGIFFWGWVVGDHPYD